LALAFPFSFHPDLQLQQELGRHRIDTERSGCADQPGRCGTHPGLIENTESPLRFLAELAAADPGYFRTEESRDLLYRALTSAAHIDAAYVSFEDGYHRVVTRIDEDRRRADPRIPATANWHSSYIDAITFALSRVRHRNSSTYGPIKSVPMMFPTDTDIRTLPGYQAAKTTRTLAVTEPSVNPIRAFRLSRCGFRSSVASNFLAAHRPT